MLREMQTFLAAAVVLASSGSVSAAGITYISGAVTITGSAADDQVIVRYTVGKGGNVSSEPTEVIEASILNLGITQYYSTQQVDLIRFAGLRGDDFFHNQTWIDSNGHGGSGNDLLIGGHGSDDLDGGTGSDELIGGSGNDVLAGRDSSDLISGGPGYDFIVGGDGDDFIDGGEEDDSCFGDRGNDLILGGPGDDIAHGGDGADTIDGGDGRDIIIGGASRDDLTGGAGEDVIVGGDTLFPLVHASLNMIWIEWTSVHSFGIRVRNVLGMPHLTFDQRLNSDEFLRCGVTVAYDGALDQIHAHDGQPDLLIVDQFDDVASGAPDIVICD